MKQGLLRVRSGQRARGWASDDGRVRQGGLILNGDDGAPHEPKRGRVNG